MCGETPTRQAGPPATADRAGSAARARRAGRRRGSGRPRPAALASLGRAARAGPAGRPRDTAASAARAGRPEQPDPLLATLAEDPDLAAAQVERAEIRGGQLADPQAGGVGGLDERPVAQREGGVDGRLRPGRDRAARRARRRRRRAGARPARPRGRAAGGAAGAASRSRPTGRRARGRSRVAQRWNERIAARRWATVVRGVVARRGRAR